MSCNQCRGIENVFDQKYVSKELKSYHLKGPIKTTRILIELLKSERIHGMTLLDIGGGFGAIQHALLAEGVKKVTSVEAATAYFLTSQTEAKLRAIDDKIDFHHGDFVELAEEIDQADIVTLDRVICCYPDMERLVDLSAHRARKYIGLVYPRDTWWVKAWLAIENVYMRIIRNPYRGYLHNLQVLEQILNKNGFIPKHRQQTAIWQVIVYEHLAG